MRLAGSLTGLFLALLLALAPATREQGRGREEQAKDLFSMFHVYTLSVEYLSLLFDCSPLIINLDKAFIKKEPLKT